MQQEAEAREICVELDGVSCTLGGRAVLSDLSLRCTERRIGIVGRNGSGKSTLARLLSGLIRPDAGVVRINGVDVAADRAGALRTVGILFQNPDHQIIFPTVSEELAFGLTQMGQTKADARVAALAMLTRFNCAHWADRAVAELSQGQRHLVCLMSVLAMQPAVLILDEPFSGLDIPTTRALRAVLDGIAPAILQITHDPGALDDYDRVIWLEAGSVRTDGLPSEVLAEYLSVMTGEGSEHARIDLTG